MKLSAINTFSEVWNVIRENYKKTRRCMVYAYGGCDNLGNIDRLYENARDIDVRFVAVINPHRLPVSDLFDYVEKLMRNERVILFSVVWFRDNNDLNEFYEETQLIKWIEDINNCGDFFESVPSSVWPISVDEEKSTEGYYRGENSCAIDDDDENVQSREFADKLIEDKKKKRKRETESYGLLERI